MNSLPLPGLFLTIYTPLSLSPLYSNFNSSLDPLTSFFLTLSIISPSLIHSLNLPLPPSLTSPSIHFSPFAQSLTLSLARPLRAFPLCHLSTYFAFYPISHNCFTPPPSPLPPSSFLFLSLLRFPWWTLTVNCLRNLNAVPSFTNGWRGGREGSSRKRKSGERGGGGSHECHYHLDQ